MPSSHRLAAAVTAAALLTIAPGAASAEPEELRLSAGATSETTLVVATSTVLDTRRMAVSGAGRVGGLAVLTPTGALVAVELRVGRWTTADGPQRVAVTEKPVRLAPGRYRLVVFADAAVTVTVPLLAGRSQVISVARPTSARVQLTDLLAAAPVAAGTRRTKLRYPGAFVFSQTYFRARAHQAEFVSQCFAPALDQAESCLGRQGFTGAAVSPGSVGDGYTSQFAGAYGTDLPARSDVDVLLQAADVDAPTMAEWLVVTA